MDFCGKCVVTYLFRCQRVYVILQGNGSELYKKTTQFTSAPPASWKKRLWQLEYDTLQAAFLTVLMSALEVSSLLLLAKIFKTTQQDVLWGALSASGLMGISAFTDVIWCQSVTGLRTNMQNHLQNHQCRQAESEQTRTPFLKLFMTRCDLKLSNIKEADLTVVTTNKRLKRTETIVVNFSLQSPGSTSSATMIWLLHSVFPGWHSCPF